MYKINVRLECTMPTLVPTTSLRNNLSDVLETVAKRKDFLLVTKRNSPISAIVNLDFFEDLLALTNKKYLDSIKKAREDYKKGKVFSHAEVFGKL